MNRLTRSIHKFGCLGYCLGGLVLLGPNHCILAAASETVVPGSEWQRISPAVAGLDSTKLDAMAKYLGGRGFVTRFGHEVHSWGEFSKPGDVASAVKPVFTHFLLTAVQTGKLTGVDTHLAEFEPRLKSLNEPLGFKDRGITFRHCANQMSCYGVGEEPGLAFDYNDFQMALFIDTLFLQVFNTSHAALDRELLHPLLT